MKKLPLEFKKVINLTEKISKQLGMPAYLVGGCLRDLILQVKNFDLDIVVEGNGIIFAQKLAKELKVDLKIHERFGTATLILANRLKVDIATAREEKYPTCASLPVVKPGSLEADLFRRDFTINAIAASIFSGKIQKFIDPFCGRADLKAKKIRILHDLSFKDDPTRILRAIRFEQRFNFKIEPKTFALLKDALTCGLLNKVSPHRMRDELILILKELDPVKPISRLGVLGGLYFINHKLKISKTTLDLFKAVSNEVLWFNKNFTSRRQIDIWLIYLSVLLRTLSLKEIKTVVYKLGLTIGEIRRILSYSQLYRKLIFRLSKPDLRPAQIFAMLEPLSYEIIILLRASSSNKYLKKYIRDFLEIYNGLRLYVNGSHLHKMGVLPGPRYKKIFAKALNAKLNGEVKNLREELKLIKKLVKTTC